MKCLAVDFTLVCAPVVVGTKCNQVPVLVLLTGFPWSDVVNVDVGMAAARNGAPMTCLNKNGTSYGGGNLRSTAETHNGLGKPPAFCGWLERWVGLYS